MNPHGMIYLPFGEELFTSTARNAHAEKLPPFQRIPSLKKDSQNLLRVLVEMPDFYDPRVKSKSESVPTLLKTCDGIVTAI